MKEEQEEIDHEYTDKINCPFCGFEDGDSWETEPNKEDLGLLECKDCGKHFYAYRSISISYSTEKATCGTCRHCGQKEVPIENLNSSIGKYQGLCLKCGEKEKYRLEDEHMRELEAEYGQRRSH